MNAVLEVSGDNIAMFQAVRLQAFQHHISVQHQWMQFCKRNLNQALANIAISQLHAMRSACLPYTRYWKTRHHLIWLKYKRTCTGNPCYSAKPAETVPPSTCSCYQLICTTFPMWHLAFLSHRYRDPKVCISLLLNNAAGFPALQNSNYWQLRAIVSRVVPLSDAYRLHLLHESSRVVVPPPCRHKDNACNAVWKILEAEGCYQKRKVETLSKHSPVTGLSQFQRRTHTPKEMIKDGMSSIWKSSPFLLVPRWSGWLSGLTHSCLPGLCKKISVLSLDLLVKDTCLYLSWSAVYCMRCNQEFVVHLESFHPRANITLHGKCN